MARQNYKFLLFYKLLLIAALLAESPRRLVECRTLPTSEVESPTIKPEDESSRKPSTTELNPFTTESAAELLQVVTLPSTTSEPITEATTVSAESYSFAPSHSKNRSLYDELKSSSLHPTFSSTFETSSEFMKFENLKMSSEESKSEEMSLETKFNEDKNGFKTNATKEERHTIDEATFEEQSVKYSSLNTNSTKDDEAVKATALPALATTAKKGKYLDLMPAGDDNMNASIPNAAEVWALAGMREVDTRRPTESEETSTEVELLDGSSLNNTAKNLLDWTEIAKMNNDSMDQSEEISKENLNLTKTTVANDIGGDDDPVTSENKDSKTSIPPVATTLKTIIEDNRIELENGNVEFANKSLNSRIDSDVFANSQEEREESAIELIDSFKKGDKKENLQLIDDASKNEIAPTTESNERFTTESAETVETTTMESYETTTSIVDSFTVIGEDEESDDIFKRTITEQPPLTTEQPVTVPSTTTASEKLQTTTELPSQATNEIPESTQRYNKTTKSISTRVATTEQPDERFDSTIADHDSLSSTLIPKFVSSNRPVATTQQYDDNLESSASPTIEIVDDEKFRYSTWLPETTTSGPPRGAKSGDFEESTTKASDSLSKESLDGEQSGSSSNIGIISGSVSVVVLLVLGAAVYFVLKRRNKQNFSQRCRPVGLDAYSLDNVSVYNSVRRKANALRLSKRSYGNSAFEDPSLQSNVLDYQSLQDFTKNKLSIQNEFKEIPQVSARVDEVPDSCEDKNRYANVVPLPETRVHLQRLNDDEKTEYINANYVKGPKDGTNYYIATQAPLENTVGDFWRMIWEQNSKVIIMATDLTENGVERSAEYIPASVVLDNSQTYGDFQVTLKSREVKGKYAVSQIHLKNLKSNTWREIMHLWYSWPENGCPTDNSSVISLLLEARSFLRTSLPEHLDENSNAENNKDMNDSEKLSTLDKTKSLQRVQGPLTVHCSPGTGRTGTLIACDIILRQLETPPRQVDIPQIVYYVRRGRANAIRTKDQYEFIYNVANAYATKLNTAPTET